MADQSAELIVHILSHPPKGAFIPCAYYGEEEDALMFYFRNDPDYAKRVNSRVTVYLSEETDELVGCQIKGVGRVLRELGELDLTIKHKGVKLKVVLLAVMEPMSDARKHGRFTARSTRRRKRPTWISNFSVQADGPGQIVRSLPPPSSF